MKIKSLPPRRILPLFLTRAVFYTGGQIRYRTDNSNDCQMDSLGIYNFRHVLPKLRARGFVWLGFGMELGMSG